MAKIVSFQRCASVWEVMSRCYAVTLHDHMTCLSDKTSASCHTRQHLRTRRILSFAVIFILCWPYSLGYLFSTIFLSVWLSSGFRAFSFSLSMAFYSVETRRAVITTMWSLWVIIPWQKGQWSQRWRVMFEGCWVKYFSKKNTWRRNSGSLDTRNVENLHNPNGKLK